MNNTFKHFFIEQQQRGYWKVSTITPTPTGHKRIEDRVYRPVTLGKRGVLGVFYSRYVPRNQISDWVNNNEKSAVVKWVESTKAPNEQQTINDKTPTKRDYTEWPAMIPENVNYVQVNMQLTE